MKMFGYHILKELPQAEVKTVVQNLYNPGQVSTVFQVSHQSYLHGCTLSDEHWYKKIYLSAEDAFQACNGNRPVFSFRGFIIDNRFYKVKDELGFEIVGIEEKAP